jgi:hypothetical protein
MIPKMSSSYYLIMLMIDIRSVIYNIKELLTDRRIRLMHTLQEENACADYLAKMGAHNPEAYSPLAVPPDGMNLLLLADLC